MRFAIAKGAGTGLRSGEAVRSLLVSPKVKRDRVNSARQSAKLSLRDLIAFYASSPSGPHWRSLDPGELRLRYWRARAGRGSSHWRMLTAAPAPSRCGGFSVSSDGFQSGPERQRLRQHPSASTQPKTVL